MLTSKGVSSYHGVYSFVFANFIVRYGNYGEREDGSSLNLLLEQRVENYWRKKRLEANLGGQSHEV
jgi:hypothetical protein